MNTNPPRTSTDNTAQTGVNAVEAIFLSMKWLFHRQLESDFGIDAQAEVVDDQRRSHRVGDNCQAIRARARGSIPSLAGIKLFPATSMVSFWADRMFMADCRTNASESNQQVQYDER